MDGLYWILLAVYLFVSLLVMGVSFQMQKENMLGGGWALTITAGLVWPLVLPFSIGKAIVKSSQDDKRSAEERRRLIDELYGGARRTKE